MSVFYRKREPDGDAILTKFFRTNAELLVPQ
jgi:hypothetical protein